MKGQKNEILIKQASRPDYQTFCQSFPTLLYFLFSPQKIYNFSVNPNGKLSKENCQSHNSTLNQNLAKEPDLPLLIRPETKSNVSFTKLSRQKSQIANDTYGENIRRLREEKNFLFRKAAAPHEFDTTTLSKVERTERPMAIDYLKPLSQILKTDYKELQFRFSADSLSSNYGKLEYLEDGLDKVINQLKRIKN